MKIALQPPPPLLPPPPPILPWSYLTLLSICFPLGSSLKITLPPTLTRFQLPSWQCFRFGSHRSPHSARSPWHIAPWDISHPRRRLNNSARSARHPLPPPSSHTSMHTYAHMNIRQGKYGKSPHHICYTSAALQKSVLISRHCNYCLAAILLLYFELLGTLVVSCAVWAVSLFMQNILRILPTDFDRWGLEWGDVQWDPLAGRRAVWHVVIDLLHSAHAVWKLYPCWPQKWSGSAAETRMPAHDKWWKYSDNISDIPEWNAS